MRAGDNDFCRACYRLFRLSSACLDFHSKSLDFITLLLPLLNVLLRKLSSLYFSAQKILHTKLIQALTAKTNSFINIWCHFNFNNIYSLNSLHSFLVTLSTVCLFCRWLLLSLYFTPIVFFYVSVCRIAIWSKHMFANESSHASNTSKFNNLSSEMLLQPHNI